jgi:hypothetical protein
VLSRSHRRAGLREAFRVPGDQDDSVEISGSRLIRIAAARPMPWLHP